MTKRVNRIYLIIAVFFLLLSILIPVVDYFMSKAKVMDKGNFTTDKEYSNSCASITTAMNMDLGELENFYTFFEYNYENVDKLSIMYKAMDELQRGTFNHVITWFPSRGEEIHESMFFCYILDKILWLLVAYCIFVIPISMVDLFSKAIRKGVE